MTIASAEEYVSRMNRDEDFRNSVIACRDANERSAFVRSEGFTFSAVEANAVKPSYNGMNINHNGCCTSPDWYK